MDAVARDVTSWTGNDTRVLEFDADDASEGRAMGDPVLNDIRTHGLVLHGPPSYLRRIGAKD